MKINERYVEMERFLQFWVDIYKQNPNYRISRTSVYDRMIKLGVSENDRYYNNSKNGNFDYWVTNFSNNKTKVFVNADWPYFCQFINDWSIDKSIYFNDEHIKMYIPLDGEHIKLGTQMIFEFLSENDIKHISKVGKEIRFDGIVVRLASSQDAQKLQKFLDNNKYIQKGLLPPNPFAYNENNIAYACDGRLSYNTVISNIITIYFNERKDKIETVGLQDFIDFTYQYYQDAFITRKDERRFLEDFELDQERKVFGGLQLSIQNYKQIFELFLKTIHPNFHFEHLANQFQTNAIERKSLKEKIQEMEKGNLLEEEINSLIINAFQVMSEKYGIEAAKSGIAKHIETGKYEYITRTNGIREKFLKLNIRTYFLQKMQRDKTTLLEELNNILSSLQHSF